MKKLPKNLQSYAQTSLFTEKTIPQKILENHTTKAGSWALIILKSGKLEYIIENAETLILSPNKVGVIEPTVPHRVKPIGKVSFYVEFYK
ncbi:tellurite resistance protein [PVC group bacterium (ex Bugula neritina AB1)]|nr:tellurite resistance protein [PVC group bacterium (ex Bugula neritina AB1)]